MGAGALHGHSTNTTTTSSSTPRTNQVFPSSPSRASCVSPGNGTSRQSAASSTSTPAPARSQPQTSSPPSVVPNNAASHHHPPRRTMPNKVLSCDTCDNNFTFFKRKKLCKDCLRTFCSTCLPKPPTTGGPLRGGGGGGGATTGRQCSKCTILTSGKFTRQQLGGWRVKDMRCFLDARNIPTATCKEKHDVIELVLLHFCLESNSVLRDQQAEHDRLVGELADRMRNSSFYDSPSLPNQVPESRGDSPSVSSSVPQVNQTPTPLPTLISSPATEMDSVVVDGGQAGTQAADSHTEADTGEDNSEGFLSDRQLERRAREMQEAIQRLREELLQEHQDPETRPGIQRASIDDLETAEAAGDLTVRQLKEILVNNFVDYRGCCEKRELVERVRRLWTETHNNRQRAAEALGDSIPQTVEASKTGQGQEGTVQAPSSQGQGQGSARDPEAEICKICMDAAIDCILLECGHMVTCTKCGKRLADCPICRQYITRVVHVFRS